MNYMVLEKSIFSSSQNIENFSNVCHKVDTLAKLLFLGRVYDTYVINKRQNLLKFTSHLCFS